MSRGLCKNPECRLRGLDSAHGSNSASPFVFVLVLVLDLTSCENQAKFQMNRSVTCLSQSTDKVTEDSIEYEYRVAEYEYEKKRHLPLLRD